MTPEEFEAWATAHGWTRDQWYNNDKGDLCFNLQEVAVLLGTKAVSADCLGQLRRKLLSSIERIYSCNAIVSSVRSPGVSSDNTSNQTPCEAAKVFIDLFSGCGGLSLGLLVAGWNGLFAVEKDSLAYETLSHNLIGSDKDVRFDWPEWLPQSSHEIGAFIDEYRTKLASLEEKIDLIAGGPPCQGFSLAGRRKADDPRNEMFQHYKDTIGLIKPKLLLIENVRGISVEFGKKKALENGEMDKIQSPFSEHIRAELDKLGYHIYAGIVRAVDYGVPQWRPRYIFIGVRKNDLPNRDMIDPFKMLEAIRQDFLQDKSLPIDRQLTVSDAISDLETNGKDMIECVDSPGFKQISYTEPITDYQTLMHGSLNGKAPNSLRLANHREETRERFQRIITGCRHGVQLSKEDRELFGLKKHCTVPLEASQPSHTITTLPDDLIHYAEPRILSVRENARIQSFPDWFEFKGKYTTGGDRRKRECPRYTQVGNAVPPLLAEAIGRVLMQIIDKLPSLQEMETGNGNEHE